MTPTPAQAEALTRIADEFGGLARQIRVLTQPATPAQDTHTPREQPQTRSGGTESGDEPFVAASALGDKLRTLGVRFQHGVSNSDPANDEDIELSGYAYWVTVQGIEALAAEVDRMAQTLDGALTSAAVFKEERDRLRAQVEAVRAAIDREAAHGDAVTRCNLVAERFRTVLDGAGGNGEVGA